MRIRAQSELVGRGLASLLEPHSARLRLVGGEDTESDLDLFEAWTAGSARAVVTTREFVRAGTAVLLCPQDDALLIRSVLESGARGYLSPRLDTCALVDALVRIHRGEVVVERTRAAERAAMAPPDIPHPADVDLETVGLSQREVDVLVLVTSGMSNSEIAETTYLSPNTVKSYLRNAYRKIGVSNRVEAVLWASEHGLVAPRG